MLVRGTTPPGEEQLARARRLRRATYILFFAFLLLVLLAIPFFISRFSQIILPDDPAFLRRAANPDAVWTFRPAPVAQRLFDDAIPSDLSAGLDTLHQLGQVFVYHATQPGASPEWVLVISRRRPQQIYDGALRRLFPLEEQLHLDLACHIDRDRLIIASGNERLDAFRQSLKQAGSAPKVDVAALLEDPELGRSYVARFRGEWGLLPKRFTDAVTELATVNVSPDTPVVATWDRLSGMIAVTHSLEDDSHLHMMQQQFNNRSPSLWHHTDEKPWIILDGISLTGEIQPGTLPPPKREPESRTH